MCDCENNEVYFDALVSIERTLNIINTDNASSYMKRNISFLKKALKSGNGNLFISENFLDKEYTRNVCIELQNQLTQKKFNKKKIKLIKSDSGNFIHLLEAEPKDACNLVLIFLVIIKVIITLNPDWCNSLSRNINFNLYYNASIDMVTAVLVVISYIENRRKS